MPAKKMVTFHYQGLLDDGTVFFDSEQQGGPLTITIGFHQVMRELEDALDNMSVGEEATVHVGKAYGEFDPGATQRGVLRSEIEDGDELEEGMTVVWHGPKNPDRPIPARITRADDFTFDIDFNHPLVDKDLSYFVRIIDVA